MTEASSAAMVPIESTVGVASAFDWGAQAVSASIVERARKTIRLCFIFIILLLHYSMNDAVSCEAIIYQSRLKRKQRPPMGRCFEICAAMQISCSRPPD
jgi:hypothetical protein